MKLLVIGSGTMGSAAYDMARLGNDGVLPGGVAS
jgi:hypothetical protein